MALCPANSVRKGTFKYIIRTCPMVLPNPYITRLIVEQDNDGSWNSSIRDTARACSALSTEGIVFMASARCCLPEKEKTLGTETFTTQPMPLQLLQTWELRIKTDATGYLKTIALPGNR
ncbi:hypothetical protein [Methanosarcina barkeri]|uniref:hypothetical protein n=1 Tax=Methanosarcina barkeri TaxID=2208 RepID=UPI001FB3755C|nr:hypothetical protein [Methanosarcina barkeri]